MAPVWFISLLACFASGQVIENYVVEIDKEACTTPVQQGNEEYNQYFDSTKMACELCSEISTIQKTSADVLTCECQEGYRYRTRFGGNAVTCEQCAADEVVSDDGWECTKCASTATDCQCPRNNVKVGRGLSGSWYSSTNQDTCLQCQDNSAPNSAGDRCLVCHDNEALGTVCPCTEREYGGFCFLATDVDAVLQSINEDRLYEIPRLVGTDDVRSTYFADNLVAALVMCGTKNNATACQVIANLCVLILYNDDNGRICDIFRNLQNAPTPQLYYVDDPDDVIYSTDIPTSFTFEPPVTIPFVAVKHSLEGKYLGTVPLTDGLLQLCDTTEKIANAAYLFGTYYSYSCNIKALGLWDRVKHPLEFFDIYMKYTSEGQDRLFKIPLRFLNLLERGSEVNRDSITDWVITRRMFLVDNLMTVTTGSDGSQSDLEATVVRYVQDITIDIELQENTKDGKIYVPYFTLTYGEVTHADALSGATVPISFTVRYDMSLSDYKVDFQIATGTISTLAVLYAGYRAWVWSKRAGRPAIDFPTIVNFIFYMAASLSNAFFVITFGIAFYWFIFFKRQDVVFLVHPDMSGVRGREWMGLFASAFTLRCLATIHLVIMQCSVDIFLIDWERPRGVSRSQDGKKGSEVPVSIWRTYFVANEWNEIQASRRINKVFQIFAVVFFLEVVGFVNTTTKDPDGSVEKDPEAYHAEQSFVYRYALAVMVYIVVGVVQWIFFTFVYERFIEDKVQQFVDLCSMSNISVFIMAHSHFGYYIHGRSVHGKADTDMREMCEMMKKEEEDLCGQRGLVPNTEQQTFIMTLPKRLRAKYEQVYLPAALENAGAASRMEQGKAGSRFISGKEKVIEAYSMLNKFLCGFIDHSLREVDYVVKDKTLLESIMDTEFFDATEKGIFYNDNGHSFDQVLFCGNEMSLLLFDMLLFCIVDHIATNFVLAGVITYIITELVCMARDAAARRNLARKTLVDERFLI